MRSSKILAGLAGLALLVGCSQNVEMPNVDPKPQLVESTNALRGYLEAERRVKKKHPEYLTPAQLSDTNGVLYHIKPEEVIPLCGYSPIAANVNSLKEAQVILIGDRHDTNNFVPIIERLTNPGDFVLVEDPIDGDLTKQIKYIGTRDELRERLASSGFITLGEIGNENSPRNIKIKKVRDAISKLDNFLQESRQLNLRQDPRCQFEYTAIDKGLNVRAIDSAKEFRHAFIQHFVKDTCPTLATGALSLGMDLHPFFKWLIYDDLKLTKPTNSPVKQIEDIMKSPKTNADPELVRQKYSVTNLLTCLEEARTSGNNPRTFVFYGAKHIEPTNGYGEYSFTRILESNGIPFVAFKYNFPEIIYPSDSTVTNTKPVKRHVADHFCRVFIPEYVQERKSQGAVPFTNNIEDLPEYIDQISELSAKSKKKESKN